MLSSTARPLQLDQWANTKAPLTSSQRTSVNRLAEWLHRNSSDFRPQHEKENPPPSNLDGHANPDATNKAIASDGEASNGTVKHTSAKSSDAISLPEKGAPLASAQDFLAWYTQLSDSITSSTQTSHRQALQRISDTTSTADNLLAQLEACQVNVSELRAGTAFVQDSSRGIREQAQSLLDSQTHLDTLAEEIASRLSFFTLLPYATNMLSSPDSSIVYSQSFLELMDQLDMALLFLQQEPAKSYRDAALYRMRYSQCVTRAATLAKMAVVRDFRAESERTVDRLKGLDSSRKSSDAGSKGVAESTADAKGKARELTDSAANGSTESALTKDAIDVLLGGAEHQVAKLRPLIFELQKRASNTAESSTPTASTAAEFESQLQECRVAWFQYRRPLLSRVLLQRIVEVEIRTSSQQSSLESLHPLVQYARSGTDLVRSILQKEHDLYQQFFGTDASGVDAVDDVPSQQRETDAALASYLAEIADTFTARLRPKLFKEENLVVLAQTSAAISDTVYADDREGLWKRSLQAVVNEAQSRLIARAQVVVSSDIANFKPSEERGDLDFPERIKTYKASLLSLGAEQNSASATPTAAAAPTKGQHRRGKSGAGLLDAALPTAHAASSSSKARQEKVELFTLPAPLLATYYAPIEYMLELLFNLQARVPAGAFRRVAIAAIDASLASISSGSQALIKRTKGDSLQREDGWLFEVRQLEILRETVVSAELVLKQAHDQQAAGSEKEADAASQLGAGTTAALVDLSSLVAAINSLWTNTGRLFYPSATVADAVSSTQLDMEPCSSNVASKLQTLIEQLSNLWSDSIILPLRVYIDQSAAEASAAKFQSTYQAFETCIESIIPEKASKVMLWVEDQEVQKLIVSGVAAKMDQTYARFYGMKPDDAADVDTVSRMAERVKGEWGKVLSL